MYYTMKQKIHPDKVQIEFFERCIDNQRFYYNQGLSIWNCLYTGGDKKINGRRIRDEIRAGIKGNSLSDKDGVIYSDLSFLNSPSNILESACENLDRAWKNFFRKGKTKGYTKNRPKFKCRRNASKSFTIGKKTDSTFIYFDQQFGFTKIPSVLKLKEPLRFEKLLEDIKTITISNDSYGWYISITYLLTHNPFNTCDKVIDKVGIDLGIKDFAITSELDTTTGKPFKYNLEGNVKDKIFKLSSKLKRMQRILAKKRLRNSGWKQSVRYELLKNKIAHIYQRIAYIKENFLHDITNDLTECFNHIAIEDLNISGMMKNHRLSRVIHESLWYKFKEILTYKAERKNVSITLAGQFFPSSKTCSCCGNVKKVLKLSERVYKCEVCGTSIDRDYNAALNLKNLIPT